MTEHDGIIFSHNIRLVFENKLLEIMKKKIPRVIPAYDQLVCVFLGF